MSKKYPEEYLETREVSLRELVEQMAHVPDDETFRWYQDSKLIPSGGWHQPTVTYRVTMGQARRELGITWTCLGCGAERPAIPAQCACGYIP